MSVIDKLILISFLLFCMNVSVKADSEANELRGELLYITSCDACHTSSIHWRDKKLVNDWNGLKFQVTRWQEIAKASWSAQDIEDVTLYLNKRFYHYSNTEAKTVTEASK
ncbi:MAG: hypothetical protein ACO1N8_01675 [Methylophilus sp.]